MHVPLPEVPPDDSNPRGFSEPQWVVDVHDEWLRRGAGAGQRLAPGGVVRHRPHLQPRARPDPGQRVARAALRRAPRAGRQGPAAELVPRPVARRRDPHRRDPGLRHHAAPARRGGRLEAEVLRQQARLGAPRGQLGQHAAPHRAGHPRVDGVGEAGQGRVFVRYEDLLTDWVKTTTAMGHALDLQTIIHTRSDQIREVHRFIDPNLRRVTSTLDDLALPKRLHDLTGQTWEELNKLADEGGDTTAAHATFDQLREEYVDLYEEAEAISRSTAEHARHQARRRALPRGRGRGDLEVARRPRAPRRTRRDPAVRAPRRAQGPRAQPGRDRGPAAVTIPIGSGHGLTNVEGHDGLRHRLAVEPARRPAARRDRGAAGQERGPRPALRAAAAAPGVRPRAAGRQRVGRRHRRGGAAGRGRARPVRPVHPEGVPLRGGPRRRRAPRGQRALGALARLLLQLVLLPRPHPLLVEVGRRHGPHHRGRGVDGRPVLAGRDGRGGHPLPAPRPLHRVRAARLPRPRPAQHRGVGLPDEPRLRLHQGAGVGDPHDARPDRAVRAPAGPVRRAEVARRRRVRPLDQPRVVRDLDPQPPQAPRVAGLERPPRRRGARGRRRDRRARGRARRRPRHPHLAARAPRGRSWSTTPTTRRLHLRA